MKKKLRLLDASEKCNHNLWEEAHTKFLKLQGDSKIKQGFRSMASMPTSRVVNVLKLHNIVGINDMIIHKNVIINENRSNG